jgi:hypothetical protein
MYAILVSLSLMHAKCPTHLIPLDLTSLNIFGED